EYMAKQKEVVRQFKVKKEQLEAEQIQLNKKLTAVSQSLKHNRESIEENQSAIVAQSEIVDAFLQKEPFIDRSELRQILNRTDIESKEKEVRAFHQEKSATEKRIAEVEQELVQKEFYNTAEDEEKIKYSETI